MVAAGTGQDLVRKQVGGVGKDAGGVGALKSPSEHGFLC